MIAELVGFFTDLMLHVRIVIHMRNGSQQVHRSIYISQARAAVHVLLGQCIRYILSIVIYILLIQAHGIALGIQYVVRGFFQLSLVVLYMFGNPSSHGIVVERYIFLPTIRRAPDFFYFTVH